MAGFWMPTSSQMAGFWMPTICQDRSGSARIGQVHPNARSLGGAWHFGFRSLKPGFRTAPEMRFDFWYTISRDESNACTDKSHSELQEPFCLQIRAFREEAEAQRAQSRATADRELYELRFGSQRSSKPYLLASKTRPSENNLKISLNCS